MKVLKGILRVILVIIGVVLVFAVTIVCTYVLNSPNSDVGSDSRKIISGPWKETIGKEIKDGDLYSIDLNQSGEFKIVKGTTQIADGWFKIDEKSHKIKMLMLPDHYTEEFNKYVKFKVLSEMSYSNLKFQIKEATVDRRASIIKDQEPSISFLITPQDGSNQGTLILNCKMYEYTINLYSTEHDLTKD